MQASGSRSGPVAAGPILLLFGAEIFNSMYRFFYFKIRFLNGREAAV